MEFQSLRNINLAYKQTRFIAMVCIVIAGIVVVASLVYNYKVMEKSKENIYLVADGKSLFAALRTNMSENRPIEAKEHVKRFHELFFTLDPDNAAIQNNINDALFLADQSAKKEYDNLKEKGFYSQLISASISLDITPDSVQLDINSYPWYARFYGKERVIRLSSVTERKLITECYIRNVTRSDNNPHGFIIEKWRVLDNADIRTYNR